MPQASWQGHATEAHVSIWSEHDFRGMDYLFAERDFNCLAMVRGYLNRSFEWIPPVVMQRFGYADTAEFYASDPSRLSLADVESRRLQSSIGEIRGLIPPRATYILADELQTCLAENTDRRALPFLERNGQYWGRPTDAGHAIGEIDRMRCCGCTHIVFAWPARWWLDYYAGLNDYLRSNFPCPIDNERLVAFDLRAGARVSSYR